MEDADTDEGAGEQRARSQSRGPALTASQLHALLDILTHFELYAEVERFKYPDGITRYGYPFVLESASPDTEALYSTESSAPLLANLLRTVMLPLPGVRDLPGEFWSVRFQGILVRFAEAELSESYDKGALGTRKTLATASSVIHESISRGCVGKLPRKKTKPDLQREYDVAKADDIIAAWENGVHELVYGDLVDELFDCAIEKESLEEHSPAVKAAADYVIIQ
jgi:hypothetical protein